VTFETKHLIEVSDVLGFEFECKHCKTMIALPSDSTKALWQCPGCNEDWILPGTNEQNAIQDLFKTFKNAERALQGRPFSMRLRIAAPPKP
jgi:hypothetical protein